MAKIIAPFAHPPLTDNSSTAKIQKGTRVHLDTGGEAVYVQAASECAQYNAVLLLEDNTVINATTAASAEGTGSSKQMAFMDEASIASSNYGWVILSGRPKVKLAANCADQVTLFTTATAGTLDDATVSNSMVAGVVSGATISNATAVTVIVPTGGAYVHLFTNPA